MSAKTAPPPRSKDRQYLDIDVVDRNTDRFICSLRMPWNPLFGLSLKEVLDFVYQKRPTLKYRQIVIEV